MIGADRLPRIDGMTVLRSSLKFKSLIRRIAPKPTVSPAPPVQSMWADMAVRSESGPEEQDGRLYFPDDAARLSEILGTVFDSDPRELSGEARCVRVLKFISSEIRLGHHTTFVPSSAYIDGRLASCGGFAASFADLVRMVGIPARYLGLFGLPNAGSHALCEAFYDGSWHLFDATFGVFFYSRAAFDGLGRVLSAKEVVTAPERPTLMQAVSRPWGGNFGEERFHAVEPVGTEPTSHVLAYWREENRLSAYPLAYGNNAVVSFPMRVDLESQAQVHVGHADGSWQDVYKAHFESPRTIGYFYLGGDCPKVVHTLDIGLAQRGVIDITYVSTDDTLGTLNVFPLASFHLLEIKRVGRTTRMRALINDSRALAMVWCEGMFWIDAMTFELVQT